MCPELEVLEPDPRWHDWIEEAHQPTIEALPAPATDGSAQPLPGSAQFTDNGGGSWTWSYDGADDLAVTSVTITSAAVIVLSCAAARPALSQQARASLVGFALMLGANITTLADTLVVAMLQYRDHHATVIIAPSAIRRRLPLVSRCCAAKL